MTLSVDLRSNNGSTKHAEILQSLGCEMLDKKTRPSSFDGKEDETFDVTKIRFPQGWRLVLAHEGLFTLVDPEGKERAFVVNEHDFYGITSWLN